MAKATNKSNQNDIVGELSVKYTRLIAIQNELKVVFDYKWIKVVGVIAKQFKIDHPDTPMPYDIDKMQEQAQQNMINDLFSSPGTSDNSLESNPGDKQDTLNQ